MRLFVLLALALCTLHQVASICHPKDFGHGSIVCVCSETLKCDGEFHNLTFPANDHTLLTGFRVSKAGDRFLKQEHHFSKDASKAADVITVKIDPSKKYQKILGFGAAFTDSAGAFIAKQPKALQDRLMRDFFAADGIEYNMCRVPIGGTDFSPRGYSLDDHENDDTLEKFALQPEDYNFKIPYIKMAQSMAPGKIRLFGSAWAAPAWMKTNHKLNMGGFLIGEPGGKYYKLFAKYLAKFLDAYKKESLPMWGLTTCNEPQFGFQSDWGNNVIGFNGTLQRDWVKKDLGPILKEAGYGVDNTKLMVMDDNVYSKDGLMTNFVHPILADAEAAKYVSGVAFHWYSNSDWFNQIKFLDELSHDFPNVFFLNTEACELRKVEIGNWTTGARYAADIITDLNHNGNGWVEWNLALNHDSYMESSLLVNEQAKEYYKQPSFYAMGAFSKFYPPESVRLHHEAANMPNTNPVSTFVTVFQRPDGAKVATIQNKNSHAVKFELQDPVNGYALIELPEHSFETVVWH